MQLENTQSVAQAADMIGRDCLAVRVRLLNRTITAIYDDALRPLGITVGQLNILVVVANRGSVSPGAVARRLNMDKSTVSRTIRRMRENGWVSTTDAGAGRRQELGITPEGAALLEKSVPAWEDAQIRAKAMLGPGGADSIYGVGNAVWSRIGRE